MRTSWTGLSLGLLMIVGCTDPIQLEDTTADPDSSGSDPPPPVTTTTASPTTASPTTITTTTTTTAQPTSVSQTITDPSATADGTMGMETEGPVCSPTGDGPLENGEGCTDNDQCSSGVCALYTDAPLDIDAICEAPPFDCSMRITGTVFNIVTQQPVAGVDVVAASALDAAINPNGARQLAYEVSANDGRLDTETFGPIETPIGVVAIGSAGGFWTTIGALAAPGPDGSYGVANDVHDLWLVSEANAASWSNMLALDPAIDPTSLPLGDAGGVVGLARDAAGLPLADVSVTSTDPASSAVVRYLNLDGTFNATATSGRGLFVILDPGLAEVFEASLGGVPLGTGTTGSASGAIFALAITAP